MKNRKWLTYTLGTLLTLVVLAAVALAGFRIGMTQNPSFTRPAFARGFNGAPQAMQRNFQDNGGPQVTQGNPHDNGWTKMQGNPQNRGFDTRGNNRGNDRRGGMSFFSPILGLIRLVVLGLLLWLGYTLVKKSGWRLTRVQEAVPAPAPVASETDNVEVEKKKKSK
jgi:hypothetical protein